jgi:hypothetical protein
MTDLLTDLARNHPDKLALTDDRPGCDMADG